MAIRLAPVNVVAIPRPIVIAPPPQFIVHETGGDTTPSVGQVWPRGR